MPGLSPLTRDEFRERVFARDKHLCVLCGVVAQDAHHIIERKLWGESGGYYLDNGASVCGPCHMRCEKTEVSVEEVRRAAGIRTVLVPAGFDPAEPIDKWGNGILPNGLRLPGPLADDVSVRKVLTHVTFSAWVKYPRTPHLPWSPGMTSDDTLFENLYLFEDLQVVVTRKMDGENTTLYRDGLHARSLTTSGGADRDWVKRLHGQIAHDIPEGYRVCGENLFARHSIAYENLESYFMVFSVWDDRNVCLSWDETEEWANLLNLVTVPVLYRGLWSEKLIKRIPDLEPGQEGYVVRLAEAFGYSRFGLSCAKHVRAHHVTTSDHWRHQAIVPNKLRDPR